MTRPTCFQYSPRRNPLVYGLITGSLLLLGINSSFAGEIVTIKSSVFATQLEEMRVATKDAATKVINFGTVWKKSAQFTDDNVEQLRLAIQRAGNKGILVVASAGNGRNVDTSPVYPCSHKEPNIVCVKNGSSYGVKSVDLQGNPASVATAAAGIFRSKATLLSNFRKESAKANAVKSILLNSVDSTVPFPQGFGPQGGKGTYNKAGTATQGSLGSAGGDSFVFFPGEFDLQGGGEYTTTLTIGFSKVETKDIWIEEVEPNSSIVKVGNTTPTTLSNSNKHQVMIPIKNKSSQTLKLTITGANVTGPAPKRLNLMAFRKGPNDKRLEVQYLKLLLLPGSGAGGGLPGSGGNGQGSSNCQNFVGCS